MKLSDYKQKTGAPDDKTMKMLKTFLKGYEGKSEDELIASIVAVAAQKRKEGTLTDAELDRFYAMLAPNVTSEQRKKLDEIVAMLKKS